jgi:hypothetical protein
MVKASGLVSTAMKARGVTKFPIPALARANQKKKRGFAKFSKVLPSGVLRCQPVESNLTSLGK